MARFAEDLKRKVLELRRQGSNVSETAKALNLSPKTVVYLSKEFALETKAKIQERRDLVVQLARSGMFQRDICNHTGENPVNVCKWLHASGVRISLQKTLTDDEKLAVLNNAALPCRERRTQEELARFLGCSTGPIKKVLKENKVHTETKKYVLSDVEEACAGAGFNLVSCEEVNTAKSCVVRCFCGVEFNTRIDSVLRGNVHSCGCKTSQPQIDITNAIKAHFGVVCEDRSVLDGMEIDILIPSKGIGVEYCGLRWHSIEFLSKGGNDYKYHQSKMIEASRKGIKLFTVFEDEWLEKPDVVLSVLKSKLGIYSRRVFARKCSVVVGTAKEFGGFVQRNHLQGDCGGIHLGLVLDGDVVAVMVFRKNSRLTTEWELARYCCLVDCIVVGGFSKLLRFFVREFSPREIISLSDNRWSDGGVYRANGFELVRESPPSYWYVNGKKRYHKSNFCLRELKRKGWCVEGKTEAEITKEHGLSRIYDCGKKTWVLVP